MKDRYYTYLIINTLLDKYYIGSRKAAVPEEDLGTVYFSSSTDKAFLQDQKINHQNYDYLVLDIFATEEQAKAEEVRLHSNLNVGINERFYNRARTLRTQVRGHRQHSTECSAIDSEGHQG